MDGITFSALMNLALKCGLPGLILVLWYLSDRGKDKLLRCYRDDTQAMKNMYEDNVALVKVTQEMAKDLKSIVIQNTGAMTTLAESIKHNDFCPFVRDKKQIIPNLGEQ